MHVPGSRQGHRERGRKPLSSIVNAENLLGEAEELLRRTLLHRTRYSTLKRNL
jgi:hypothetical protein